MTEFQLIHLRMHAHTNFLRQMDKHIDFLLGKVFVRSIHQMLEHSFYHQDRYL
jgi:hypothetical protein